MGTKEMRAILKDKVFVLVPESEEEKTSLQDWVATKDGHVFSLHHKNGSEHVFFGDLGLRTHAFREPINILFNSEDPGVRLISNLAHAPFELDGGRYESVEGFWQGLKFQDPVRRKEIAMLSGHEARRAGHGATYEEKIIFHNQPVRVGTHEHWRLMARACRAKFEQHLPAQKALIETGSRPLVHRTRRDSQSIPGVIMADIWMRIRNRLAERGLVGSTIRIP